MKKQFVLCERSWRVLKALRRHRCCLVCNLMFWERKLLMKMSYRVVERFLENMAKAGYVGRLFGSYWYLTDAGKELFKQHPYISSI